MEGIVNSLLVYSIQLKREINLDLAQRIVRKAVRCAEVKPLTVDNIIEKVCSHYKVDASTIHTKTRKREVVQVRQVAMYLAKNIQTLLHPRLVNSSAIRIMLPYSMPAR